MLLVCSIEFQPDSRASAESNVPQRRTLSRRRCSSASLSDGLTCSTQIPINFCIVGARLTGRRDILSPGRLQDLLGPFLPVGVLAMDRDQDPSVFDTAFVALSFVFWDAHSYQRSGDAADRTSYSGSSERGHDRAGGDKWTQSGNCEGAHSHQPAHGSAEDNCSAGTCRGVFRGPCAFFSYPKHSHPLPPGGR